MVQNGTQGAFTTLCDQYRPLVLSLVDHFLPLLPDRTLGHDDLVQEANIALYRAAMRFDLAQDKVTFGLFAKVCIRNRLVSVLRRQRRLAKAQKVPKQPSPARDVWLHSLYDEIRPLLTDYEEQVLRLRIENYSYKEIAQTLEKDPKSVDNAMCRIRQKIKEHQKSTL